mgnify:CR=1 FL=1
MKRIILILISGILLSGCGAVNASALSPMDTEYRTSRPTATASIIPTATIEYQATAAIASTQLAYAQATANEASRLNTQATAEYEQRVQVQLQMTADYEAQVFEAYAWTVTAALTSVPLTATQQAALNVQIPTQQALARAEMTKVKEAPTQMKAMIEAEQYAKYWPVEFMIRMFAFMALGVFLIGIGAFAWRSVPVARTVQENALEPTAIPEMDPVPQVVRTYQVASTPVTVSDNAGGGFGTTRKYFVPCSPEQLTELAEKILSGEKNKTLAINEWEGSDTKMTRSVLVRLRSWLQLNQFAQSIGAGRVVLAERGESFLQGWLNAQTLPTEYDFEKGITA